MYLGQKNKSKPRTLGQKLAGGVVGLGTKIGSNILTGVALKTLPKILPKLIL